MTILHDDTDLADAHAPNDPHDGLGVGHLLPIDRKVADARVRAVDGDNSAHPTEDESEPLLPASGAHDPTPTDKNTTPEDRSSGSGLSLLSLETPPERTIERLSLIVPEPPSLASIVMETLNPLDFVDPERWDRLRLAGEGFGNAQGIRLSERNRLRIDWKTQEQKEAAKAKRKAKALAAGTWEEDFDDEEDDRPRPNPYPVEWTADYMEILDGYTMVEEKAKKALLMNYRRFMPSAIKQWVDQTQGVGEHLIARLVGITGDPVIRIPHRWEGEGKKRILLVGDTEWRSVSQLWAYCGYGDASIKRAKGMSAEDAFRLGNPKAKSVLWNMSSITIKFKGAWQTRTYKKDGSQKRVFVERSPYRDTYEMGRERYAQREDWKPIRQHNAALRLVSKQILKDLWRVRMAEIAAMAGIEAS